MDDDVKCCNGDCNQGRDCPHRDSVAQIWADLVALLIICGLCLFGLAGFFNALWR